MYIRTGLKYLRIFWSFNSTEVQFPMFCNVKGLVIFSIVSQLLPSVLKARLYISDPVFSHDRPIISAPTVSIFIKKGGAHPLSYLLILFSELKAFTTPPVNVISVSEINDLLPSSIASLAISAARDGLVRDTSAIFSLYAYIKPTTPDTTGVAADVPLKEVYLLFVLIVSTFAP